MATKTLFLPAVINEIRTPCQQPNPRSVEYKIKGGAKLRIREQWALVIYGLPAMR